MERVDTDYLAGVRKRLDPLFEHTPADTYDPKSDRIVVFSDHHRGEGDGADDFRRCEHAYTAALGYYRKSGYRLFLLGDVEELWESHKPDKIFDRYGCVLELERSFVNGEGLVRFWGNHDDRWADDDHADELFQKAGVKAREAYKLNVRRSDGGTTSILFVHGHQGTRESEGWRSKLARIPVGIVWTKLQRAIGASATTPARDSKLRSTHDRALFEWSRERPGRVVIAGHTHRPVFSTPELPVTKSVEELEAALAEAEAGADRPLAARIAAELEYAKTIVRRPEKTFTLPQPSYFNTGCCSFPDGDVTGIELADDEIRLVRWPGDLRDLRPEGSDEIDTERRILARKSLANVIDAVALPPDVRSPDESPLVPGGSPGAVSA
jgi:hypothetical protein